MDIDKFKELVLSRVKDLALLDLSKRCLKCDVALTPSLNYCTKLSCLQIDDVEFIDGKVWHLDGYLSKKAEHLDTICRTCGYKSMQRTKE